MRVFVRLVRTYVKPYWFWMLIAMTLTSIAALNPFVFNYMGKRVVDDVLEITPSQEQAQELSRDDPASPFARRDTIALPDERKETIDETVMSQTGKTPREKTQLLLIIFFTYIIIHILSNFFSWVSRYNIGLIGQKVVFRLRSDLHNKLQALQMTYFDQTITGKLMARVIDDVNVIRMQLTNTAISFFRNLTMLVIGITILFAINWRMALVAISCLPLYAISYQFFVKRIRQLTRRARELNSNTYGLLAQKISGIRVVKSFVREKSEMLRYHRLAKDFFRTVLSRSVFQALLGSIAMIISGAGTAFVLWYGAVLVREGRITTGDMLFFHGTVAVLFGPVMQLSDMNVIIQWMTVIIARVFNILDEEVTIKDAPDAIALPEVKGRVEFKHVSLQYTGMDPRIKADKHEKRHGKHEEEEDEEEKHLITTIALRDVNMQVEPGQMLCIMGASGSGKTSLVSLIPRLYEPTSGRVLIDGYDVTKIKLTSLRKHIGLVPQESAIFSGTIADNIRYGAPYAPMEDVIAASKAAEIHTFIEEMPDGYETKVGEQGVTLSGGQKQRLSIARALITHPKILLLDDCTSALDAKTEAKIQETLSRILSSHTSIVITHRTSMAMKADKIAVLDDGKLVEFGTHEELLAENDYYWRIFNSQQKDIQPVGASESDS